MRALITLNIVLVIHSHPRVRMSRSCHIKMGGTFGKNKNRVTLSDIVTSLEGIQEQIVEGQLKTEKANDSDRRRAKQLLRMGRRDEAKNVLMRIRYRERQMQRSNTQLNNIGQLAEDLGWVTELTQPGKEKVKRGKWKFWTKKHKKRPQNIDRPTNIVAHNVELIEIQKLDEFKKKEKQIILTSTRKGIEKQREIGDVISQRLGIDCSNEALDRAVEDELEAIMHADYQPPDMHQDNISNTKDLTSENPHELRDVVAEIAEGA